MREHFGSFGFPLVVDTNLIPPDDDLSTLFICSGMQPLKRRFREPDGSNYGSLQSCLRANDLDAVGDGTHLSYFEMLGNFRFGGDGYEESVELWSSLMRKLQVPITHVRTATESSGNPEVGPSSPTSPASGVMEQSAATAARFTSVSSKSETW